MGRPGRPLGRSWSGHEGLLGALGRVLGALGAVLEASWPVQVAKMPPEVDPRGSKIDFKRRLALKTRILQKAWFSQWIFMIFEVPGRILKASWRSWRHLGPLEGLLKHLECILRALGGLLERLEGILSALGAILAENVAWTCMEPAWNVTPRRRSWEAVRHHAAA